METTTTTTNDSSRPYFKAFKDVMRDSSISYPARFLFFEITELTKKTGTCTATREYLSTLMDCSVKTISRYVEELEQKYIKVNRKFNTKTSKTKWEITLINSIKHDGQNCPPPINDGGQIEETSWTNDGQHDGQNCPPIKNNINKEINKENNNINKQEDKIVHDVVEVNSDFVLPSQDELVTYWLKRGGIVKGGEMIYERLVKSNGFYSNKTKMESWESAVDKFNIDFGKTNTTTDIDLICVIAQGMFDSHASAGGIECDSYINKFKQLIGTYQTERNLSNENLFESLSNDLASTKKLDYDSIKKTLTKNKTQQPIHSIEEKEISSTN